MNNTTTTPIVAVFIAATLVVGTLAATTTIATTQSAFAYPQKKKGDDNSRNGNTITIQKCKQAATQSGFDNNQEQECQNLICTHPGENATCTQEGAAAATPTPVNKTTCEQCFTSLLRPDQISSAISILQTLPEFHDLNTVAELCQLLEAHPSTISEATLRNALLFATAIPTVEELIACLKNAGIVFPT